MGYAYIIHFSKRTRAAYALHTPAYPWVIYWVWQGRSTGRPDGCLFAGHDGMWISFLLYYTQRSQIFVVERKNWQGYLNVE